MLIITISMTEAVRVVTAGLGKQMKADWDLNRAVKDKPQSVLNKYIKKYCGD